MAAAESELLPVAAIGSLLAKAGLVPAGAHAAFEPLTGGIASDIWRVAAGDRVFAVKRALPKLRVAADWRAPVSRNASEADWLRVAGGIAPDSVPRILFHDAASGLFAMDFLPPDRYPVWKGQLRDGNADPDFAAAVGATLARIHRATAGDAAIAARFDNDPTFHAIRLEPYLEATAGRHPVLAERLFALSRDTLARHAGLVHGDVSPKNILAGPNGPVFLDAECAWYGDPAFDLAFCLNHLLLKCVWNRAAVPHFLAAFDALADAYFRAGGVAHEVHAAALLPALFLARIDGKSPVEYIVRDDERALVRGCAVPLVADPPAALAQVRAAWARTLEKA